jgi:hypothetical protein
VAAPPVVALAAAERLAGLVALIRSMSVATVDGLVASMSPADLEGSYYAAEPGAVARLLAAQSRAAREAVQAASAGIGAWGTVAEALSTVPDAPPGLPAATDMASVLRQTVLVESKYRIGTGMEPVEALESARLRGGRAAAGIGADTTRGSYTATIQGAGMGWARVPTAQACPFCLLMASRGPVYKSQQTAQGKKGYYHPWDRCRTLAVPRGAQPGDYLDGEIGGLVQRADDAYFSGRNMTEYLSSDFAKAQNAGRVGSPPSASPPPNNPFGVTAKPMTRDAALAGTNPLYSTGGITYRNNCTRCVVAYEARLRGFDVQAASSMPDLMHAVADATFELPPGAVAHKWVPFNDVGQAASQIAAGQHGTRYWVHVRWPPNGGTGHVFMAENRAGATVLIDPQSGVEHYGPGAVHGSVEILRVDELDFAPGASGFTMAP